MVSVPIEPPGLTVPLTFVACPVMVPWPFSTAPSLTPMSAVMLALGLLASPMASVPPETATPPGTTLPLAFRVTVPLPVLLAILSGAVPVLVMAPENVAPYPAGSMVAGAEPDRMTGAETVVLLEAASLPPVMVTSEASVRESS